MKRSEKKRNLKELRSVKELEKANLDNLQGSKANISKTSLSSSCTDSSNCDLPTK